MIGRTYLKSYTIENLNSDDGDDHSTSAFLIRDDRVFVLRSTDRIAGLSVPM